MQGIDAIFYILVLIFSVVLHEVAHGYAAYHLGDNTAKDQGRLTLNPVNHIDLFGSVILPFILIVSKAGFVLGWAKPVPYNPNNLSNKRWGGVFVASAGALTNIALAIIFSILIRIGPALKVDNVAFYEITGLIVITNIALAIFNLIPIPPLDGSRILFGILGDKFRHVEEKLERFALIILIFFVIFLSSYIGPVIMKVFSLLTGLRFF